MRKLVVLMLLTAALVISLPLLAYFLALPPGDTNRDTMSAAEQVEKKYSGWKGVESMVTPLDEYIKAVTGGAASFSDLIWPHADSQNPFQDLLDRGVGVAIVTITSVKTVYRYSDTITYVVYDARID